MKRDNKITVVLVDSDGCEVEHDLPARFEVCPRCEGRGTHVNPAIDGHGISQDEWERDWDEESRENYFSGVYDVACYECNGLRVVPVVDEDRCPPDLLAAYLEREREDAEFEAVCRMERMMGA